MSSLPSISFLKFKKNIIHSKATLEDINQKSSLLYNVMTNKNLIKSENLLAEFENNIHGGDLVEIQECVFQYMGSSVESEEAINKINKFQVVELNWKDDFWPLMKLVLKILILQPLFRMTPISIDIGTDTKLLYDYRNPGALHDNFTMQHLNETEIIDSPSQGKNMSTSSIQAFKIRAIIKKWLFH